MCLNIKICKYLFLKYTNMSSFQPLEVVGRGSETQLQVAENFNKQDIRVNFLQQATKMCMNSYGTNSKPLFPCTSK